MSQSTDGLRSIAEMPAQRPRDPATAAQARGRFFNTGNAFNVQLPPVPDHLFTAEPAAALAQDAPTGLFACDLSDQLACTFPATTPLVLARYARIRPGETLDTTFTASGIICYVIRGSGSTADGHESVAWSTGDLVILPGGPNYTHTAETDAVLWIVTNEPQLAFEHLRAPDHGKAPTAIVHFTAAEIERQIAFIYEIGRYSVMDGRRKDWSQWATSITPPTAVHSHHNGGNEQAMFLIIQDGGIFYHARAMGFEFAEHPE